LDDLTLKTLIQQGVKVPEIADRYGVTKQAIYKRLKNVGQALVQKTLYNDSEIFGRHLKTLDQLIKINEECFKMVDSKDTKEFIKLQAMRRIEAQNELQIKLYQAMYSVQEVRQFQQTVLEVLHEVDPSLKQEVLKRFKRRRSLSGMLAEPHQEQEKVIET